jgi:hypothetical protein
VNRRQRTVRLGGLEIVAPEVLAQVEAEERAVYLRQRAELAPLPPAAQRSDLAEGAWQAQIVAVAQRLGFYVYHPKLSRWSERGWPDLSLLGRRALWIEAKRDDTHLTPKQVEVILRMRACGLEVHVLRPWHGLQAVADLLGERQLPGSSWTDPKGSP